MMKLRRERCAILPLVLKAEWYDMIECGVKREEYRTSPRVLKQIQRWWGEVKIENKSAIVEFRRGYRADAPRMTLLASRVYFRPVDSFINPDQGEPTDAPHYAIVLEGIIPITDKSELTK